MKNILVVLGGGRPNGNTEQLVDAFIKGATDAGHTAEKVLIRPGKLQVRGCTGCYVCRQGNGCALRDDFNELVPKIKAADLIVFASPLYYWTITSELKAFVERFFGLATYESKPPRGRYDNYPVRDSALLMTAADDLFWTFSQVESYYRFAIVNYIGCADRGMYLAGGCGDDEHGRGAISRTDHLEKVYEFGKSIYAE